MKKFLIGLVFGVSCYGGYSQGLYNNGAKIVIDAGVTTNVSGTGGHYLNAASGGAVGLSGTLIVQGNLTNNVAAADFIGSAAGGSKVVMGGSTAQTIGGTTSALFTFPDLTINNSSGGVVLAKDARVNGTLTFTNGLLTLGSSNLTLSSATAIAGTPSAASMVVATGTGQLRREYGATGSFTFPVGDNTGTAEYSPVTLNITAGTFGAGAYAGVNLVNAAYPDPFVTGTYISRYWNLSQSGITGLTSNALFNYTPADVTGTENNIYSYQVNPAPITPFVATNASIHQLTTNGLTAFGSFTGALGIRNITMKLFMEGLYDGGGTMRKAQGDFGDQFLGTVADVITVELHDPANYPNVIASMPNINLSTAGLATVPLSLNFSGSYYLAVKNRNLIETVSIVPVTKTINAIDYDFSNSASKAFGDNQKNIGVVYVAYGGDANGDGVVDGADLILVENDANMFAGGYLLTDLNGDGVVDGADLILAENNANSFVSTVHP